MEAANYVQEAARHANHSAWFAGKNGLGIRPPRMDSGEYQRGDHDGMREQGSALGAARPRRPLPVQGVQRSSVGGPRKDPRRGKRLLGILPNALKQRIPRRIKRTEGSKEWFAQGCTSMDASEGQDEKPPEATSERVVRSGS